MTVMPILTKYDSESRHHLHPHSCISPSPHFLFSIVSFSMFFSFNIFLFVHLQVNPTKDGSILGMYRIPHGRKTTKPGRPVFLRHDLLHSSATWMINFPDQSIGYLQADAACDVIGFAKLGRSDSIVQNNVSFYAALAPVAHSGHIK